MIKDLDLIQKVKEKIKESSEDKSKEITWAEIERFFNIPKNGLNNVRYGACRLPKKHRHSMTAYLFQEEKPNLDNWNLSAKRLHKWKFPGFIKKLMVYCKQHNIKTSELIDTHKKVYGL